MKKIIFITLTLLFSLSVFTCDDKDKPEDTPPVPLTLDQRLVGGRWYFWSFHGAGIPGIDQPKTANGYYEFKDDMTFMHSDRDDNLTEYSVYTKNNTVYRKDTNKALLQYQFYSKFPVRDLITGSNLTYLDEVAAINNLMTCTVYNSNLELTDDFPLKIIRRFKDDGTPYEWE